MDDVTEVCRPGYYAVIPSEVRYDDRIPANAKLLYGEISALVSAEGFCYATNQYFSKLYGMADETIARLITKLERAGHIVRVLERDQAGQIVARKLYLKVSVPEIHPLDEKINTPRRKNQEGIDEKVKENNRNIIIPPISPPEGGDPLKGRKNKSRDYKSAADVLPERFEKFWTFYRTHVPPECNAGNRQKALRAWDKLAPSAELVTKMAAALAKQVKSQSWSTGVGVPHASTWLNNHGWEDDWGPAAGSSQRAADPTGNEEAAEWVS